MEDISTRISLIIAPPMLKLKPTRQKTSCGCFTAFKIPFQNRIIQRYYHSDQITI